MKNNKKSSGAKSGNKKIKIILTVVVLLVIIRLILPSVILHYANKTLAKMDGYYGHINDIDLSIYRGAYQIDGIYIDKVDSITRKQIRFFSSDRIDLSIEWNALFHGSLVGEMVFDFPTLYFTKDKVELGQVQKDTNTFAKILDDFMPLQLNRFVVSNGSIHYVDSTANPIVNVSLKDTYVLAENLTTVIDKNVELPSTVTARSNAYEGTLKFYMKINPLAEEAKFDLNAELKNTNLVLLNDFMKAYGKFDVNQGTFGLYTEMAAKNGKFKGYVKPIITDLDVVGPEDREDNIFHKAWESLVSAAGFVFKNQPKDQLATKVEMEGEFKDPKTHKLDAIWEVLKNAFIHALVPTIDNQISLKSVGKKEEKKDKSLFQKIFSESKSDKKYDKK